MGSYVIGILGIGNIIAGVMLVDKVHPLIVAGFITTNVLLFINLTAHISRYLRNKN